MSPDSLDIMEGLRLLIADAVRKELAKQGAAHGNDYLSIRHAATLADVAPGTVRRWIRERRLEPFGAGRNLRVRRTELDDFLARGGRRVKRVGESPEAKADREFKARFGGAP
jgi:excisionase family DNA binding protein